MPYSSFARRKVSKALVQSGTTYSEYESRFNATIETQAKTLVFLMIPMFALGLRSSTCAKVSSSSSIWFFNSLLRLLSADALDPIFGNWLLPGCWPISKVG